MLTAYEADLVRRDPHIPGLATVLDPRSLASAVAGKRPELRLEAAERVAVRYRPGRQCSVTYRLQENSRERQVQATAVGPDAALLRKLARPPRETGLTVEPPLVLEAEGIAISMFPWDRKLTALPALFEPSARRALLADLLPDFSMEGELQTLSYRPERHYTARLDCGPRQWALKAYSPEGYAAAEVNALQLAKTGSPLARLAARSSEMHLLLFPWAPGRTLRDTLAEAEFDVALVERAGALLAALHVERSAGLPCRTRTDEVQTLQETTALIVQLCPELGESVARLIVEIAGRLEFAPAERALVHGDFSARQIVVEDGALTLLDTDDACRGDPACDLGNFLAKLHRDHLRGDLTSERLEACTAALLAGYREARGRLPPRIGLYVALALLRAAPHSFQHSEIDWPGRMAALVRRAGQIAVEGEGIAAEVERGGRHVACTCT